MSHDKKNDFVRHMREQNGDEKFAELLRAAELCPV